MIVLLSNIPMSLIRSQIKQPVRRWLYLGTSEETFAGLKKTFQSEGEVSYGRELYDVSGQCRDELIAWLDDVSLSGAVQKEWFFSVPATKNPYASKIFLNVSYYLVAKRLMARHNDIDLIVVDSPALGQLLTRYGSGCRYPAINTIFGTVKALLGSAASIARYGIFVSKSLKMRMAARQVFGRRVQELFADRTPRTLIRNYITEDFSDEDEGIFERHFFPGLAPYLKEHGKTPLFLPITIHVASYKNLFTKVKSSRRAIIFAEEFLTLADYLYAFTAPLRALQYRIAHNSFNGQALRPIIVEDFHSNLGDFNWLNGMLLSRLGPRLKAQGIDFETIINWSEFQSFERGLIAGLRETYPTAKLIGCQAFCSPPNQVCLTPSEQERVFRVVPDKLLVLGPYAKKTAQTYLPDLDVAFTPAFRYQPIFDPQPPVRGEDLIVLFGYVLANSLNVFKMIIELQKQMPPFKRILIKLHPATYFKKERLIREVGGVIPNNVVFIDGALEAHLDQVMVGLCGTSGTAVELAARGIPVAIVAEERTLTMQYLPTDHHPDLWHLCFSPEDILKALKVFYDKKRSEPEKLLQSAAQFRQQYFAVESQGNWLNYIHPTPVPLKGRPEPEVHYVP
jgi:hypothetical protein